MNTAFGKFVSEKFFDKLFLLFLLAGTVFMACAKGSAVPSLWPVQKALPSWYLQTAPGCQVLSVFYIWQQVPSVYKGPAVK